MTNDEVLDSNSGRASASLSTGDGEQSEHALSSEHAFSAFAFDTDSHSASQAPCTDRANNRAVLTHQ